MADYVYEGCELDLFARATNWKRYLRFEIAPLLRGRVLEVGAGIGSTTRALHTDTVESWTCLEPDAQLAARLVRARDIGEVPPCEVVVGTLADWDGSGFDAILYVDVLEHIEHDRVELHAAVGRLRPGGRAIVLAPAHPWLYTPFDRAIGHYRRYTRATVRDLTPEGARLERLAYLDAAGLLTSAANRVLLRSAMPTPAQVRFWDRVLVPVSRALDPLLGYKAGKSVLAVWSRDV